MKFIVFTWVMMLANSVLAVEIVAPVSKEIPELVWQLENGGQDSLQDYVQRQKRPVLLHFWAAWCTSCVHELPTMSQWQKSQDDVDVLFISLDQQMAQADFFIKKMKLEIPLCLASMGEAQRLGIRGLPVTILIDVDGVERGRVLGEFPWLNPQEVMKIIEYVQ
ncbi:MAG: TlpA family protein disulfide reductase [Zetaproteobacteria bacterium]|nr:TlpA family protein disulfide reductase [Zetaproteobacteria bacterium]